MLPIHPRRDLGPSYGDSSQQQTGRHEATAFADAVAQAVTCGHYAVAVDASRHLTPVARQMAAGPSRPAARTDLAAVPDR